MNSIHFPRRTLWIALGILLAAILLWAGFIAWKAIHLAQTVQAAQNLAQGGQLTLAQAQGSLQSASDDLSNLSAALGPAFPLLNAADALPGIGPTLGQVEPLVRLAAPLSQAGNLLLSIFAPALEGGGASGSPSITERLASAVQANPDKLDEVDRLLQQAALQGDRIQPEAIPARYRSYAQGLARLLPMLKDAVPALKQLPALLGVGGRQDYLLLAQNRDELRATGGFISGIGTASLDGGKLVALSIGDSYAIDDFTKPYPTPPAPLKTYMLADYWVARDGNWSPDFPTAAAQVRSLYALTRGPTRGVIAFDQLAIKGLLEVTGPVKIASYPDPITAASVEDFMHKAWAPDPATGMTASWWANRKNFMGELGKVLVGRLMDAHDPQMMIQLAVQLAQLLEGGHFSIYIDQPEVRSLLRAGEVDGTLSPGSGDFLYLVDSNVGFNKVDSVTSRKLNYAVDLTDPTQPSGTITVTYTNKNATTIPCKQEVTYGKGTYADMQARCYFDYWRIYRPAGTTLLAASIPPVASGVLLNQKVGADPIDQASGEGGTQVFGSISVVPMSASLTNSITTRLPAAVLSAQPQGGSLYSLRIPKQAGLAALPLTLSVRLPPGQTLRTPPPGWSQDAAGAWTWSGTLTSGQDFSLWFGN